MRTLRQILVVTRLSLFTLPQRFKSALVIVIGVGVMVFVLLSFLSMGEGIRVMLLQSGDPARGIVHRIGVQHTRSGQLPSDLPALLAAAPGVARAANGTPLVDAQITLWFTTLIKRNNGQEGNTTILGVGPLWRDMSPSLRLTGGRMPRPGTRELLTGELARRKFSDLDDGIIHILDTRWRVVGTFSGLGWEDGWLVGDAGALKAIGKEEVRDAVLVRLASPEAFDAFAQALRGKLAPDIAVERETDHYAQRWQSLADTVPAFYIAYLLAGVIGAGILAGTMHTMHGAMEARAREVAILRAIGFNGVSIAAATVLEAMLLAMLGACLGTALVWLWLGSFLYNGAGGVFAVEVNWRLLLVGNCWGLTVALIGTLSLAVRAARQTPIEALREI
jgi:putative ABC transport system permease protein